jgi:hypothetical protein
MAILAVLPDQVEGLAGLCQNRKQPAKIEPAGWLDGERFNFSHGLSFELIILAR